ncbi:MAG: TIGR03790 family protein [Armatimonadota bacterium]
MFVSILQSTRMLPALFLLLLALGAALAGGGPQNVLVIVNGNSRESLAIGNAYRRARGIPYNQVLILDTKTAYTIPYRTYLSEIEKPVRVYLQDRQASDEITTLILTRGVPQQVDIDRGRSTASLLATLGIGKAAAADVTRIANPYFNSSVAFTHQAPELRGMYLVTVLNGYHTVDVEKLISQGARADGLTPRGRFLLQSHYPIPRNALDAANTFLTRRGFPVEMLTAPPTERQGIMAYLYGGFYGGLTRDHITSLIFEPGALVDLIQSHGASENNFDESQTPVLASASWFVQAGASGIHAVVGNAGINSFPGATAQPILFDRYTGGLSLGESFYAALPYLNWQNVILGDPLCAPYARRPQISIHLPPGPIAGRAPVKVTVVTPVEGMTISRLDLYLDDHFWQTLYEPEVTRVSLRIGESMVTYVPPPRVTLQGFLEGLAAAINSEKSLAGPDGVRAAASLSSGSVQLTARAPGSEGNAIPVTVRVEHVPGSMLGARIRLDGNTLSGGGQGPTSAHATISFLGRRVSPGDQVTIQIEQEKFTATLTQDKPSLGALIDDLTTKIAASPAMQRPKGVRAIRDQAGMPYLQLEARTPGDSGNDITFQVSVKQAEGSQLRAYPAVLSRLAGGSNGSAATTTLHVVLGEPSISEITELRTTTLIEGFHRLRAVAYDGSLNVVQGIMDATFIVNNFPGAPVIMLPERIAPVGKDFGLPVSADETVQAVNVFIDGRLCGKSTTRPFIPNISLEKVGAGLHDLWAEGIDAQGRSYRTPPVSLEVLATPQVMRITPDHASGAGDEVHVVIGAGFLPGCTVTLGGVPARSVKYFSPNMLEVVSGAGPAGRTAVEVTNPGGTRGLLPDSFEYYAPRAAGVRILPARDTIAPGRQAQFVAECVDQFNHSINVPVQWRAGVGKVTASGLYTAPEKAGSDLLEVRVLDTGASAHSVITVGTAELREGRMRQWLVLGPFPDPEYTALMTPLILEEQAQPSHNDTVEALSWISLEAKDDFVDFSSRLRPSINTVAYAHVYVYAPINTDCVLLYGSDDGIRIWLNGVNAFSLRTRRPADPNQNRLPITLKQGWNRLLVKVDQGTGAWGFYMRLLSPQGQPLNGIQYALDRPGSGL